MKLCLVNGCERKKYGLGYCSMHYQRVKRHGSPGGVEPERVQGIAHCTAGDCDRPVKAKGLCVMHYARFLKHGDPTRTLREKTFCTIENCNEPSHGKGLCAKHWARKSRWGSPEVVNPTSLPGKDNSNWRGNDISYSGAHRRVYRDRGSATNHFCSCGEVAQHWAYDHECPEELSEMTPGGIRHYSGNTERYIPMCVPCHKAFDLEKGEI